MGLYIEDSTITKEQFLEKFGEIVDIESIDWANLYDEETGYPNTDKCLICLIDNVVFKAAGIAYDSYQCSRFINGVDQKRCIWYLIPCEHITKLYPDIFNDQSY